MQKIKVIKGENTKDIEHLMNQSIEDMFDYDLVLCSWDYVEELGAVIMCFDEVME